MIKEPSWVVKKVTPEANYRLRVTFSSGETKIFDCTPLLTQGVFRSLKDKKLFDQAHVSEETVVWNDDLDIAAETLYSAGIPA